MTSYKSQTIFCAQSFRPVVRPLIFLKSFTFAIWWEQHTFMHVDPICQGIQNLTCRNLQPHFCKDVVPDLLVKSAGRPAATTADSTELLTCTTRCTYLGCSVPQRKSAIGQRLSRSPPPLKLVRVTACEPTQRRQLEFWQLPLKREKLHT
jgi:hypothetical protein